MASREQNERNFDKWQSLRNGGRRYVKIIAGRAGGQAHYIKEVDATEKTTRFTQHIFNADGKLIEVHEKFPIDLGHKRL